MRLLRAIGFAITYPVVRIGGASLSRLAQSMQHLAQRAREWGLK